MNISLTVSNLTVRHGNHTAVDNVSRERTTGLHALLGPNGAGKTTLIRAIATLQKPTDGTVSLDGHFGSSMRPHFGYLPQENLGKSRFTVREHLAYMCWLKKLDKSITDTEIDRLLTVADLVDRADSRISSLSGGMRRRVGIASALVGSPSLVLLDEPTAGLDVSQRDAHQRILDRVADEAIVIVSTHIVEDVLTTGDTLTVMSNGGFLFDGCWGDFGAGRDLAAVKDRYLKLVSR